MSMALAALNGTWLLYAQRISCAQTNVAHAAGGEFQNTVRCCTKHTNAPGLQSHAYANHAQVAIQCHGINGKSHPEGMDTTRWKYPHARVRWKFTASL